MVSMMNAKKLIDPMMAIAHMKSSTLHIGALSSTVIKSFLEIYDSVSGLCRRRGM